MEKRGVITDGTPERGRVEADDPRADPVTRLVKVAQDATAWRCRNCDGHGNGCKPAPCMDSSKVIGSN